MMMQIIHKNNETIKVYFDKEDKSYLDQLLKFSKSKISDCGLYRQKKKLIGYDLVITNTKTNDTFIKKIFKDYENKNKKGV